MASPDFKPYVDLTLFDADINDIYTESVEYAKTSFPEFLPRTGTIENAILESVAYATTSLVASINRLPNGLMEGLLNLMGFARVEATPAQATVQFEVTVNTGVTILQGTVVSYDVFDSEGALTQFLFETNQDLNIASGSTTGTVAVTAVSAGEYPDIVVPQALTLVSTTPYVFQVTLQTLATIGTDTETDTEYFDRGVKYLASLSTSITTANQMTNYISVNYPTVARFKVYDLTDSFVDMSISASPVAGAVAIALCDSVGDPIPTVQKNIIKNDISSKAVAGLTVATYDMHTFNVNVTASISVEPNYSTAAVSLAVSEAIEAYLSIAGWDFATSVDAKYLTTIASKITGVKYVDALSVALDGSTTDAADSSPNVTLLKKGAIPIGECTTTAV